MTRGKSPSMPGKTRMGGKWGTKSKDLEFRPGKALGVRTLNRLPLETHQPTMILEHDASPSRFFHAQPGLRCCSRAGRVTAPGSSAAGQPAHPGGGHRRHALHS